MTSWIYYKLTYTIFQADIDIMINRYLYPLVNLWYPKFDIIGILAFAFNNEKAIRRIRIRIH